MSSLKNEPTPKSPEPESEEFIKFKTAMLKIISVRKEDIVDKLPKGDKLSKKPRNKRVQGRS